MRREIEARLKLSAVDRTGKTFESLSRRMEQINRRAEVFNRTQSMMGRHATAVMAAVSRLAAPAAMVYGAKEAITSFAELERRIIRMGLTAGATDDEMKASLGGLRQMAKDNALSFDQVAEGMETLVASGKNLQEAMAFLPAVLAAAQASGAATDDIANTAIKTASALKIETSGLQDMFDRMVYAGNLGQFELEDMARYIPNLANSFASLGYRGSEGLNELLATLQVLRADTGTAESAAQQAQNVFGKMYSDDMVKKFKKFGVDLRKELKAAEETGEGALKAFTRLTRQVTKGDLSKLGQLFTDQELRLGMQSLVTSGEELDDILNKLRSKDVAGTVGRQLDRVVNDTEAKLQRLQTSFTSFMENIGGTIAPVIIPATDYIADKLDEASAIRAGKDRYHSESGINSHDMLMDLERRIGELPEYKDMNFITKPLAVREAAEREIAKYGRGQAKSPFEGVIQQERANEWQDIVKAMQPQLEEAHRSYQTGGRGALAEFPGAGVTNNLPVNEKGEIILPETLPVLPQPRGTERRKTVGLASQYGELEEARRATAMRMQGIDTGLRPEQRNADLQRILDNLDGLEKGGSGRPWLDQEKIGTEVGAAAVQRFGADAASIGGEIGDAFTSLARAGLEAAGPVIAQTIAQAIRAAIEGSSVKVTMPAGSNNPFAKPGPLLPGQDTGRTMSGSYMGSVSTGG